MIVDLLVVGASFAGLSCAMKAAQCGLKVVVLEKKTKSGDKLHTTGILVKEAFEQAAYFQDAPSHLFHYVHKVRLYAPNMNHVSFQAPGYYFVTTNTSELLNWMTAKAVSCGVDVLHSTAFQSAEYTCNRLWRIPVSTKDKGGGQQKEIFARYLIGADGPNSRVARALGLSVNTEFLYGVEYEYDRAEFDKEYLHCFIDQELARGYIGWTACAPGHVQVGLAKRLPSQAKKSVPAGAVQIDKFIDKISSVVKLSKQPFNVRAGMIPCGGTLKHIARPNVLLVGDAAGTVSPVTAGGIYNALKYGEDAGVAVAHYLLGKKDDPAVWLAKEYPSYKVKGLLRQGFDRFQTDWLFNSVFSLPVFHRFAQQVYFHKKGYAI